MILTILMLAISLSLDALGVGVVYGMRKILVPLGSKLIICLCSMVYSSLSLLLGKTLSYILSPAVSKAIGIGILMVMGIGIILQSLIRQDHDEEAEAGQEAEEKTLVKIGVKALGITIQVVRNPVKIDMDHSGTIDRSESLLLGLALSFDAIGVGIGSAMAGFTSAAIPVFIGIFQLLFLYAGNALGSKLALSGKINKKLLSILPGLVLIILAIFR